jgi:hypothetical protein
MSRPARAAIVSLVLSTGVGCYPHSQAYRGAFSGTIVDGDGRPVTNAKVVVCTSEEAKPSDGCPHRAEAWTDLEGRFQFWPVKAREWCWLGQSSSPQTHLTACARGAQGQFLLADSVTVDASGSTEPRIPLVPSSEPTVQSACTGAK